MYKITMNGVLWDSIHEETYEVLYNYVVDVEMGVIKQILSELGIDIREVGIGDNVKVRADEELEKYCRHELYYIFNITKTEEPATLELDDFEFLILNKCNRDLWV